MKEIVLHEREGGEGGGKGKKNINSKYNSDRFIRKIQGSFYISIGIIASRAGPTPIQPTVKREKQLEN